jgi:hypothetical protein
MTLKLFPYNTLQNCGPDQGPPVPYEEVFRFGFGLGWIGTVAWVAHCLPWLDVIAERRHDVGHEDFYRS